MTREHELHRQLQREIADEVEAILERARTRAETLLADARLRLEQDLGEGRRQLRREMERLQTRGRIKARQESHNHLLRLRQKIVDDLFTEVAQRLEHMAAEEPQRFAELLWSLFTGGKSLLGISALKVRVGRGGRLIEERLREAGAAEVVHETGWLGVILESPDGRMRCDCSLDALLELCRIRREAEIMDQLFEAEGEE